VHPLLNAAGVQDSQINVQAVNPESAGTVEAGLISAINNYKINGVNRVMFLGGAPLGVFFITDTGGRSYNRATRSRRSTIRATARPTSGPRSSA